MKKRDYPIFLFVLLLLVNGVLAQESSKPKDTNKEKDQPMVWSLPTDSAPFTLFIGNDAYIGVYLEEVTADKVKALNLAEERGAIISKVTAGSPAEKAGMKENDVILSFNGRRVDTVRELQRLLGETPAGRSVTFEVVRGGSHQTISVTLGKRGGGFGLFNGQGEGLKGLHGNFDQHPMFDKEFAEKWKSHAEEMAKRSKEWQGHMYTLPPNFGNFNFDFNGRAFWRGSRLGVAVESMTDQLAEYFGVKNGKGVLVTEVFENSAAAKAGIKAGDIILEIDNKKVDDPGDLSTALSEKPDGQVELKVVRKGDEKKFTLTLEKGEARPFTRRRSSATSKPGDTI